MSGFKSPKQIAASKRAPKELLSARVDADLHAYLLEHARRSEVPLSNIVEAAVKYYAEHLKKQESKSK